MTDEQARKNIVNILMHNKLPEKTIQQQVEEKAKGMYGAGRRLFISGGEFALSLYEAELSSKDKLIETTHNNLLAALEENKRLKEKVETMTTEYNELWDQAQRWREESGNLPRP